MNRLSISIIGLLGFYAAAVGAADELGYSPDGGLVSFGEFDYVYDSASRLTEVWSNGTRVVENRYDALIPAFRRRIAKFGKKRLSKSEQDEVRRIYQSCIEEFQPVSSARANQAQMDWYKNNGYRLERKKR